MNKVSLAVNSYSLNKVRFLSRKTKNIKHDISFPHRYERPKSQQTFSADHPNCAQFPSLKCAHISFWLNPTGHFKFHITSAGGPFSFRPHWVFFSYPEQRNQRMPTPVPKRGVRYNSLLWTCSLHSLTWPDLTWPDLTCSDDSFRSSGS